MAVIDRWTKDRRRTPNWGKGSRWEVVYRDAMGVQHRKRFTNKEDAKDFEAAVRLSPRQRAARKSVDELFHNWMAGKKHLKPKTLEGYRSNYVAHIKEELGTRAVSTLTAFELRDWYARIDSPSAARAALVVLRGMLDLAVEGDLIAANPVGSLRGGQTTRRQVEPLTDKQIEELAELLQPNDREFWLLAACGLRFGEMAALSASRVRKLEDGYSLRIDRSVQQLTGEVVWGTPKGGQPREVPCPGWLAERLPKTGDPLLVAPNGGPWLTHVWRPRWEKAREAIGRPDLHTHDLRHSFAARQIEAGVDLKTLQVVMGHAHLSITTDLYGAMAQTQVSRIADIRS